VANFLDRLAHAFNIIRYDEDNRNLRRFDYGAASATRPDRVRLTTSNEKSIVASILTRLSLDIASLDIRHIRTDENGRYKEDIKSGLNDILNVEANLDQGAQAFRQDIAMTLFDKGVVAIVPIDTDDVPIERGGGSEIRSMRVGEIVQWMPEHVRLSIYDQKIGRRIEVTVPKRWVAIVENPLYAVMNETNSTLQRLIRKLNLLDAIDEQSGSGKLDLIIQLPYVIKSKARQEQAEERRASIEQQLRGNKFGIAYTDGTERITQLNRPTENNLLTQVEYLTKMLYSQLGLTEEVFLGTADEKAMLNYHNRTVKPITMAIVEAMKRSFLSKTAISQGQDIQFFRNPFEYMALGEFADFADKMSQNEIMTGNELRGAIAMKPLTDPKADMLYNSHTTPSTPGMAGIAPIEPPPVDETVESPPALPLGQMPISSL
jgi:hypothetical protein